MMFRRRDHVPNDRAVEEEHSASALMAIQQQQQRHGRKSGYPTLVQIGIAVVILGSTLLVQLFWERRIFRHQQSLEVASKKETIWDPRELDHDRVPTNTYASLATTDSNGVISELVWQELLDKFDEYLSTKLSPDMLLPVVITQKGEILIRQEQVFREGSEERFDYFISVVQYALKYASQRQARRQRTSDNGLPVHLPLPKDRPSIPFIMTIGDRRTCLGTLFPRFTWSTLMEGEPCIAVAIPCYTIFDRRPESSMDERTFHTELEQSNPWASKKKQAVWRGGATGETSRGWEALPRAQLIGQLFYLAPGYFQCRLGRFEPVWFDVSQGITEASQLLKIHQVDVSS